MILIGGGGEIMCAHTYTSAKPEVPFGTGSRARLMALEALGFFMFSGII